MPRRLIAAVCAALTVAAAATGPIRADAAPGPAPALIVVGPQIDGTGRTDVTLALRQIIATVPRGGTLRLAPGARYRVEGTLKIEERAGFTLDGNSATIFATGRKSAGMGHLWIDRGSDVVVRNLIIKGANTKAGQGEEAYDPDQEEIHGIRISGTAGVDLDHLTITDVFSDFVYVGRADDKTFSSDVWIHDSRFDRNGRQGIALTAVHRAVIERNRFDDMRRSTIDLEPNTPSWGVDDVAIIDNVVGGGRLRFIASHGGGPVSNVTVARNRLRGQVMSVDIKPPDLDRRQDIWIVDNRSDTEAPRAPIKIVRVDGVVVTGNVQPVARGGPGIDLRNVCSALVQGNDVRPSLEEVAYVGPTCGTPPPPGLPPVPAIPARLAALANPGTTTTVVASATTIPRPGRTTLVPRTVPAPAPTTVPVPIADPSGDDGAPWAAVLVVVAVLGVGIAVWAIRRRPPEGGSRGGQPGEPSSTSPNTAS